MLKDMSTNVRYSLDIDRWMCDFPVVSVNCMIDMPFSLVSFLNLLFVPIFRNTFNVQPKGFNLHILLIFLKVRHFYY